MTAPLPPWTGKHYYDGAWHAGDKKLEKRYPANTSMVLGEFPRGTADDANKAVTCAKRAQPQWRRTSRVKRGDLFNKLGHLIERDVDALARIVAAESGKIFDEARAEVIEGLHMVQYVFGTARQPTGYVVESEIEAKDLYIRRKPRGVVAVITPWNFPFAVPLWMLGPSLLEGNTVIFKPSEETPQIAQRLFELFLEAGFPAGTVNLVHGLGEEVGDPLARHPDVNVICFTGSYDVGTHIRKVAAEGFDKSCACEMGSKSGVIVLDDANLDLAANAILLSAFKTTGQRCVSGSRAIVHKKVIDQVAEMVVARAKNIRFGDPFDKRSFAGPLVNQAGVDKVTSYNELAKKEGAQVLLDGGRLTDADRAGGYFMSPFIYRQDYKPGVRTIREEVFGPHLALIPFEGDEQGIDIYNDTDYGLSMAIVTEDYRRWRLFRDECDYGMGYVNLPCIGAEVHLPFGGVKKSGNGQPSAAALVDAVTHKIAFTVNHDRKIVMAQGMSADVGK